MAIRFHLDETDSMRIPVFTAVLVVLFLGLNARAATYSTLVEEFAVDPSGNFAEAAFGFGVSFARIDAVSLEITMPDGLSGGLCTGSTCYFSSLDFAIYDPTTPVDFCVAPLSSSVSVDPDVLRTTFGYVIPGLPTETRILPPNPRLDPATFEFSADPWPTFLFTGSGAIGMQKIDGWFCHLNCSGSGRSVSVPPGVTSVRLIVEGVAVPEPSCILLGCIAIGVRLVGRSQRCRRNSEGTRP
jgi:hypothetical protein